jgi:hypothetical protein
MRPLGTSPFLRRRPAVAGIASAQGIHPRFFKGRLEHVCHSLIVRKTLEFGRASPNYLFLEQALFHKLRSGPGQTLGPNWRGELIWSFWRRMHAKFWPAQEWGRVAASDATRPHDLVDASNLFRWS